MVRIISVDRTKASPLCSSFDGAQSDASKLEGEAGSTWARVFGRGCRLVSSVTVARWGRGQLCKSHNRCLYAFLGSS